MSETTATPVTAAPAKKAPAAKPPKEETPVIRLDKDGRTLLLVSAIKRADENLGRPKGDKKETPEEFAAFTASVKRYGIIMPLIVRAIEGEANKYQLLAGERRLRAAKSLSLEEVPVTVYVGKASDKEIALLENAARRNLNPVQLAAALQDLIDSGMSKGKAGEALGLDNASVTQYLKLNQSNDDIKKHVTSGFYSFGAALKMEAIQASLSPDLVLEFQRKMKEKEEAIKARQAQAEAAKKSNLPKTPKPTAGKGGKDKNGNGKDAKDGRGKRAAGMGKSDVEQVAADFAKSNPKAAAQLKKAGIDPAATFNFGVTVETYFAGSGMDVREAFAELYEQLATGKFDGEAFAVAFDNLIAAATSGDSAE